MESKKIIIPNDQEQMKMFTEIGNKRFFPTKEQQINDKGEMGMIAKNKNKTVIVESNSRQQLNEALKGFTPTTQKSFIYLVNYAIQNDYIDEFDIDINEFLEVLDQTRKTTTIERIYKGLHVFTRVSFECKTVLYDKGKNGERKKPKDTLESQGAMLAFVRLRKSGRKASSIRVRLNDWFTHFKKARQNEDAYLLTLQIDCLKVNTKTFPYSFGSPYRMAQYARTNNKRKQEWDVLTLKEIIEGVEPWEEAEKKIKKYGFNSEQALIERLTQSLEHAEKPFGLVWEWVGEEPQTLREAEQAKMRFKFLQPLKNVKKKESTKK